MNKKEKEAKALKEAQAEKEAQAQAFDKTITDNLPLMLFVGLVAWVTEKGQEILKLHAMPLVPTKQAWDKYKRAMRDIRPKQVNYVLYHIAIATVANTSDQLGNTWQAMINHTLLGVTGKASLVWGKESQATFERAKVLHKESQTTS